MRIYEDSLSNYSWQYGHSTIEHFIINTCFSDSLLIDLLVCFPNLRRLSINYLTHSHFDNTKLRISQSLKDFECVTLKLDLITFYIFEKIIQNFFYYVEILQIEAQYDSAYLDAKRWQRVITYLMQFSSEYGRFTTWILMYMVTVICRIRHGVSTVVIQSPLNGRFKVSIRS
jgi:hypothetical protein